MINVRNIIFFALVTVLLSSCGKGDRETGSENKIVFWHFWSEPYQRNVLREIINEFETEYDCKVEVVELSWSDGKTKLFAAFNSGTAPDVLELGSDWVAQFSSAGVLSEIFPDEAEMSRFVDFSTSPSFWSGKIYALPWIVDTRVLFVNNDLLLQAGIKEPIIKDTRTILEYAERINDIQGVYGYGATGSDRHRQYKKIVSLFWSYGGDILNDKGQPVVNSPQNTEALEMFVELSRNGLIETQRQLDSRFTEGKLGLWVSGGWLLEKIKNENPSLNFSVSLVPGKNPDSGISFAGGEYLAMSGSTKNRELSLKFIKYMTAGMNALKFCKQIIEAGFPADREYYNDEFYKSNPYRMVFSKQLERARMTPVHPKWLDIEAIIEDAAVEALYGRKTPKEALDDAQYKLTQIIK
jgi:ABC-type glycerol-3-phosphate transport system substrate-binding protein